MAGRCLLLGLLLLGLAACGGTPAAVVHPAPTVLPSTAPPAPLRAGTCWGDDRVGGDPAQVARIARRNHVAYAAAARSLRDVPQFDAPSACSAYHSVEVFRLVRLPSVTAYRDVLDPTSSAHAQLAATLPARCTSPALARAAAATGFVGAVMTPALPDGWSATWTVVPPQRWNAGLHAAACVFEQGTPGPVTYASVFGSGFPTEDRTCIDSTASAYVDCARSHDRERIAVLDLSAAVAAGLLPGRVAVHASSNGPTVALGTKAYVSLDRGCAAWFATVAGAPKGLVGVSEIDTHDWPDANGAYLATCEASAPLAKPDRTTTGSVFEH